MSSAHRLLIQVLPRLTPARCGISDYALLLAQELEAAFEIKTAFVVLNSSERNSVRFPVMYGTPKELLDACLSFGGGGSGFLLVHLSGYGYAADGAPTLLAEALADVRERSQFRIAVFFHELYATGPPWRSAFWHSRRQQSAVRRIAQVCDFVLTNTELHAKWLEAQVVRRSEEPIQLLPVFSPAGEDELVTPIAQREPAMTVFGLGATRQNAYRRLRKMGKTLSELKVQEIWDIGPEIETPRDLKGIPVTRLGILALNDLAGLLSRSRFGFVVHTPSCLPKSTVFAAFCAHGTIPVVARPFAEEVHGLKDGIHLLSPQTARLAEASGLDRCSLAGWQWYQGHRVHVQAATYAQWLAPSAISADGETRTGVEMKQA